MNNSEEEKEELQELINLLYNNHLSQYGKRKLEKYIQKQDKIIDMAMELIARKVGSRIEICPDMNCCKETEGNRTCKQCAIEYFKKVVDEDVKD